METRRFFALVVAIALIPAGVEAESYFRTYTGSPQPHGAYLEMPFRDCSPAGGSYLASYYHAQSIWIQGESDQFGEHLEISYPWWSLLWTVRLYKGAGAFDPFHPELRCVPVNGTSTGALAYDLPTGWYTVVSTTLHPEPFEILVTTQSHPVLFGGCAMTTDPKRVCLRDRFLVRIYGVSHHASDGVATPVGFSSSDTALFWFYSPMNFEAVVKVLDGCAVNGHYWVFIGALTDQAYTVEVRDTFEKTGKTYSNTEGTRAPAVNDTSAFPCP